MKDEDKHYDNLILNPKYYKIGTLSDKCKGVLQNKDPSEKVKQQLVDIVNNDYQHHPNWSLEEHKIKFIVLHEAQVSTFFRKATHQ